MVRIYLSKQPTSRGHARTPATSATAYALSFSVEVLENQQKTNDWTCTADVSYKNKQRKENQYGRPLLWDTTTAVRTTCRQADRASQRLTRGVSGDKPPARKRGTARTRGGQSWCRPPPRRARPPSTPVSKNGVAQGSPAIKTLLVLHRARRARDFSVCRAATNNHDVAHPWRGRRNRARSPNRGGENTAGLQFLPAQQIVESSTK